MLDPTAGSGSIPLEALHLGHTLIAHELTPVVIVILHAMLDSPARFGKNLTDDISGWGERLLGTAAHMPSLTDSSVDLICLDPPYYDNVQEELRSDAASGVMVDARNPKDTLPVDDTFIAFLSHIEREPNDRSCHFDSLPRVCTEHRHD